MSNSNLFEGEHVGGSDGIVEFAGDDDGQFIFEEKNIVYDEDQMQNEFEIQLMEDCRSEISSTVLWKHVIKGKKCGSAHGGSHVFKCKHCQKLYHGTYTRVYAHLMGHRKGESKGIGYCSVVKADKNLQLLIQREVEQAENLPNIVPLKKSKLNACSVLSPSPGPSLSIPAAYSFEKDLPALEKDDVDSKVIRCLCANGIPFDVLHSPYWEDMVSSISKLSVYKSPSYERARTVLLENERCRVERELDDFKQKWPHYGISVISYGWTDEKKRPLIHVLASNQFGSMFLHAHDFLLLEKSQKGIAAYLLEAVGEVGPYNVVQLITDNAEICRVAGNEAGKIYPFIFWNPCMVHTLRLILKDIVKEIAWLETTYSTSKCIVRYLVYHSHAEDIFQSNPRLELLKVAARKGSSHYIILQLLFDVREAVKAAVLSSVWDSWAALPNFDDKANAEKVKMAVLNENFWGAIKLSLSIIKPIYKMLRFTDQDGPVIGEVCERMENMLGEIKDNLGREEIFMVVKEKVHVRWNKRSVPLQCLAFALTPKYYDEEYLQLPASGGRKRCSPDQDDVIWDGATDAIFKMHPNEELADIVRVQFMAFVEKTGRFSSATAKRDARNPKINVLQWWKFHGGDTKELREMAFKVLAQPFSTSSVERSWSSYHYIKSAKQNILNGKRADDLLYIHSNLRLLSRFTPDYKYGPHRRWDVHPEHTLLDEASLRWDDIRFLGLEDDSMKQSSQAYSMIQELFKAMENPSVNGEPSEKACPSSIGPPRGRGGRSGGVKNDQNGKTKQFI